MIDCKWSEVHGNRIHTFLYKKKKERVTNVVPYFFFYLKVVGSSLSAVFN